MKNADGAAVQNPLLDHIQSVAAILADAATDTGGGVHKRSANARHLAQLQFGEHPFRRRRIQLDLDFAQFDRVVPCLLALDVAHVALATIC